MSEDHPEASVPVEELRELVEVFREGQARCDLPRSGLTNEGVVLKECADKLEELVEQYE